MTTTNVETRAPDKMDYASPIQFRFKITKLPQVEFFIQTANIPGITLGSTSFETPLKDIAGVGDKVTYQTLDVSFLVDENLNNYKELHDWIIGLGFPKDYTQFQTMQATGADRFPGSTRSTAVTGTNTPQPLNEGGIYSDATLTVLNSKNIAKTEIRFQNVFPISLGSLSYDVKASDVDYLQVQASFNYMYYEIVQISTS
ncbi:MAG: hypothetical protein H8D92_00165 [Pelagibacteraceae bacterium]|nr:hypothetical protein [Pelagibacteraceae bacterium]